jgi:hypothetical protein
MAMGGAVRIILIVLVLVLVAAGAGYFLVPPVASRSETLTVERPPATVLARLSSAPVGATVVEGVTIAEAASVEGDTVTAPVTFATGETGRVVYTVTPEGEGSRVEVKLEQNLGANPLDRVDAITGGDVGPLISAAAAGVTADLAALPNASFEGLAYNVVQVEARPFFYIQNCAPTDAEAVTDVVAQSLLALRPIMQRQNLTASGDPIAVEPRVENNQYCYQIGYPYTGRPPRVLAVGTAGQTPAGQALRVVYTGTEEDVLTQVYNPMDALLAAAHLDDPSTTEDDWTTYEVYHDDPTQAGGSRNREIFYVAQGDISALTRIAPPTEVAVPAAAPAAAPAADPAAPAATPAPAGTPAPTPAPAPP